MKKTKEIKTRNFVAKYATRSGAGIHKPKVGKLASRAKQKQQYRKGTQSE